MMVVEGGSLGDIYGNVFVRDESGKILLEPGNRQRRQTQCKGRTATGHYGQGRQDR